MANSNVPMFTQKIHTASANTTSGLLWTPSASTTTNLVSLFTAGTNGSRVTSIVFATTDSAANNVFLILNGGGGAGTLSIVGQVNVPLTSGTAGSILAVDALLSTVTVGLPTDNNGKKFIHMEAGDILYYGFVANMTSGKIFYATAMGEDY
jgi:hypothetical protein